MAKGVKKIKYTGGSIYPKMSVTNQRLTIAPDQWVWFAIAEWEADTTAEDKKRPITWMRQTSDKERKVIINQMSIPSTNKYGVKLPKKLCGSYHYYIEASLSGKRDFKNKTGLYVKGYCPPLITKCGWSKTKGKTDLTNTNDDNRGVGYGDTIYFHADTEGINGETVTVEVWNEMWNGDYKMRTLVQVEVIDGEINVKIPNTSAWQTTIKSIKDNEEFYAKIKRSDNSYIKDAKGKDRHGKYLNIKNILKSNVPEKPSNQTPTKVYKPDVNTARYEPCKFEVIKITESEIKDGKANNTTITIFDNAKGLVKLSGAQPQEKIEKTIFFKFDSTAIDKDGEAVLNNILKFLLEHKGSTMNLQGHACVIGKRNYNLGLSQRRADVVKKFFADGGLEAGRIISVGKGEVDPTDEKQGRDNIKYKNEKDYENNRRVDISFVFNAHDAQTIIYEVIAPSINTKKELTIDIIGQETKACFRTKNKHVKSTWIVDVGQAIDNAYTKRIFIQPSFNYKVYSDLSLFNAFPIQYIWPISTKPNHFHFHSHTCRYYSNEKRTTVLIKTYPDIKWTFNLFLNLTNDLSIKGKNMGGSQLVDFQQRSGKANAEKRWKQKDASFGFGLKGEWDKDIKGNYYRNNEFKAQYETKFKNFYDVFSSIGAIADGITSKTKGAVRGTGLKGLPVTFAVKPPNLKFEATWNLERSKIKKQETEKIGTYVNIDFGAHPLVGLEMTIDLLGAAIVGTAAFFSGGAATQATQTLYDSIMSAIKKGGKAGNDKIGASIEGDIYIDLVISAAIETAIGFEFNTVSDNSDTKVKLESKNKLKVEIKAGAYIKAEVVLVVVSATGYFEAKAGGSASITFGKTITYDTQGLYLRPILGFDGLIVDYSVSGKVGLAFKKKVPRMNDPKSKTKKDDVTISDDAGSTVFLNDTIMLIPKFDVIEEMEKLFKIKIQIPIIKN